MSEIEQIRKAYINAVANRCSISRDGHTEIDTKCFNCKAIIAAVAYVCALETENKESNTRPAKERKE